MKSLLEANGSGCQDHALAPDSVALQVVLLDRRLLVTVLEHAWRALRDDPPGSGPEQMLVHRRLREEVLEAAVSQFVGRCSRLTRPCATGGTAILTEERSAGRSWRITHFDAAMNPTSHVRFDGERDAIRALVLAQA
jgi:hypothetical protein